MTKVTLVGGSGMAGAGVLRELVDRGHEVIAIVRRPDAINLSAYPTVKQVHGDAYDHESMAKAFIGADTVVSAFNPGWDEPGVYDKFMLGARTIQSAARDAGVGRLIVVGGAGSLFGEDGRQIIETMAAPEQYMPGVRAARDYYEELQTERDLDWAFLSPPLGWGPFGPTQRRGTYRVGADHPVVDADGHSAISTPDLALALVDEIEAPRHHRQRFTVGY